MSIVKAIKLYDESVRETLAYNIVECEKRNILSEYVKSCKEILNTL